MSIALITLNSRDHNKLILKNIPNSFSFCENIYMSVFGNLPKTIEKLIENLNNTYKVDENPKNYNYSKALAPHRQT